MNGRSLKYTRTSQCAYFLALVSYAQPWKDKEFQTSFLDISVIS
jgi:hypothetical protein